jgi:hypothetical protein
MKPQNAILPSGQAARLSRMPDEYVFHPSFTQDFALVPLPVVLYGAARALESGASRRDTGDINEPGYSELKLVGDDAGNSMILFHGAVSGGLVHSKQREPCRNSSDDLLVDYDRCSVPNQWASFLRERARVQTRLDQAPQRIPS